MNKNLRSALIAGALIGLSALSYVLLKSPGTPAGGAPAAPGAPAAGGGKAPPPVAVEVARVQAEQFTDEVSAVGSLKSAESVTLRPETAGRIARIAFRDGSEVGAGTLLLSLDAAIQEAELQQAEANLALARTNFQRSQELVGRKFLSQQTLDSAAATLKVQEAAVQLAAAKLAKTRIKAPFAGIVGLRNVSVGDYVKEGQDLINLEDIRSLRVDFRLPEAYVSRLKTGQLIDVASDATGGERFSARLEALDPAVDPNGRSIAVRARLDNRKGQLRPGMFVRVRVVLGERQGVLMVPEQAVVTGGQPSVFRIVDGKAVPAKVRLGVRRDAKVEIVEGVAEGDLVVTAGQLKLREGAAVRPVGDGVPASAKPAEGK